MDRGNYSGGRGTTTRPKTSSRAFEDMRTRKEEVVKKNDAGLEGSKTETMAPGKKKQEEVPFFKARLTFRESKKRITQRTGVSIAEE